MFKFIVRAVFLILSVVLFNTASAAETFVIKDFESCMKGEMACEEVDKDGDFILVHGDGGKACPGGYYFLLDQKEHMYYNINVGKCEKAEYRIAHDIEVNYAMVVEVKDDTVTKMFPVK